VEGFTEDHLAAFKRTRIERVLIAYDRDEVGARAADRSAVRLIAEGIECLRLRFPKGLNTNSTALKLMPAAHNLGLMMRQAEWIGRGKPIVPTFVPPEVEHATMTQIPPLSAPPLAARLAAAALEAELASEAAREEIAYRKRRPAMANLPWHPRTRMRLPAIS
jgi:hypothetical protein